MGERPTRDTLLDGICELTLQTRDVRRLADFYCRAFGCSEISREKGRIWLGVGTHTRLGIWPPGEHEFGDMGGSHVHFAFSCSPGRLDLLAARERKLGIALEGPVEHPGGDRSIYIEDPEGNVVEVWDFFRHGEGARDGVDALSVTD